MAVDVLVEGVSACQYESAGIGGALVGLLSKGNVARRGVGGRGALQETLGMVSNVSEFGRTRSMIMVGMCL